MESDKMVRTLDVLKELVTEAEKTTVKPASLEETQNFQHIADLKVGDKLRYKGGLSLKFPKKGEEVFVYSVNLSPPQQTRRRQADKAR